MIEVVDFDERTEFTHVVTEMQVPVLLPRVGAVGIPRLNAALEVVDAQPEAGGKVVPVKSAIPHRHPASEVGIGIDVAFVVGGAQCDANFFGLLKLPLTPRGNHHQNAQKERNEACHF